MAAKLGSVTMELLVRPKGSTAEPTVVGEIVVDLDGKPKPPAPPAPIPPMPKPSKKEASDAAAR